MCRCAVWKKTTKCKKTRSEHEKSQGQEERQINFRPKCNLLNWTLVQQKRLSLIWTKKKKKRVNHHHKSLNYVLDCFLDSSRESCLIIPCFKTSTRYQPTVSIFHLFSKQIDYFLPRVQMFILIVCFSCSWRARGTPSLQFCFSFALIPKMQLLSSEASPDLSAWVSLFTTLISNPSSLIYPTTDTWAVKFHSISIQFFYYIDTD